MSEAQFCTVEITGSSDEVEFPARVYYGCKSQPDLDQLPGDARIFIDLGERARGFEIKDALFTSAKSYRDTMVILEEKSKKTIKFRSGDGTHNKYDGTSTGYTVGIVLTSEAKQIDYLGERWSIASFKAVQA